MLYVILKGLCVTYNKEKKPSCQEARFPQKSEIRLEGTEVLHLRTHCHAGGRVWAPWGRGSAKTRRGAAVPMGPPLPQPLRPPPGPRRLPGHLILKGKLFVSPLLQISGRL